MDSEKQGACAETRRSFVGAFLAGKGPAGASDRAALHARECPACAAWLARASEASSALRPAGRALYTASLRRRTLAAVDVALEEKSEGLLWWLVPAALGGIGLWLLAPTWILTWWLSGSIESRTLAFAAAFAVVSSAGFLVSSAVFAALLRTGKLSLAPAGPSGPHREESYE